MKALVRAWMSATPATIGADAPALAAFDLMLERGVRHLPVLDAAGRLLGVVSVDDLRAALPFELSRIRPPSPPERESARDWLVGDVMTHAPHTIGEDATLIDAAERMTEARIGCLPVLDGKGALVGILSETDLLRALVQVLRHGEAVRARPQEDELPALVRELERERDRIVAGMEARRGDERRLVSDVHDEPLDEEERAADERALGLLEQLDGMAARRLDAIQDALRRAALGRLGGCERCGGRVPVARLRALPGATLCVACAREAGSGSA